MSKKIKSILFVGLIAILMCGGCGSKNQNSEPETETIVYTPPQPPQKETTPAPKEKETKKLFSDEEIAAAVLNGCWGNGKARVKRLKKAGYDPDKIQALVDAQCEPETIEEIVEEYSEPAEEYYSSDEALNAYNGVVYYDGHKETYYSQNVLPGGGLDIPGRHVAEDGTIRDENGYICVAADESYLPYGSIVETSLGTGKVYDSGCDYGTVDIYVSW